MLTISQAMKLDVSAGEVAGVGGRSSQYHYREAFKLQVGVPRGTVVE